MSSSYLPRALIVGLVALAVPVLSLLLAGLLTGHGKTAYELVRDLFVPLIGPLVAVLVPLLLFFVIPAGQNRQRTALELCQQYNAEEFREARNIAWKHFVLDRRREGPEERAIRLAEFLNYLTTPETHAQIDPTRDALYQKATRVLDFFAMVNEYVGRGNAEPSLVRAFLLYYYLWWRDEIMDPLRSLRTIADHPKIKPSWWDPLVHLDALAAR
ncbi:MAG: hypothetical protein MUF18_05490 [Fimbriiglobus sp.]|nr:hypothetical protein [Fimbriiglobus sp.]